MRLINFRPSLFCALGLAVGIFCAVFCLYGLYVLPIVVAVACVAYLVCTIVFKWNVWQFVAVCLSVLLGFGLLNLCYHNQQQRQIVAEQVVLTGRVSDIGRNGNAKNVLYLENCSTQDGKLSGKVQVVVFDASTFQTGDVVTARGTLRSVYVFKNGVDTSPVRNGVRYQLTDHEIVAQTAGKLTLAETVRAYVYNVATTYAPQHGDIVYALLTGDRNAMDVEQTEAFKSAGIIHLLAVSGLHVGFIVSIFCFVLNKFKLHPLVQIAILIVPLGFYAYVCNFTPSVLRAILMVVCTYLAKTFLGRYDLLTSLSWAVVVILLAQPLYLFDVGFQLSVLSVYGIATLFFAFQRRVKNVKNAFLKWLLATVGMSACCSVSTFFVSCYYFGQASLVGVLTNIVAIPLVTVVFVASIFAMLPWVFHYVLFVVDYVLVAVSWIANVFASIPFSTVALSTAVLAIVATMVWQFAMGGYVNLKTRGKAILSAVCAVLVVLSVVVACVPVATRDVVTVEFGYQDIVVSAVSKSGDAVVVANFKDDFAFDSTDKLLSTYKVDNLTVVVTDFAKCNIDVLQRYVTANANVKVYVLDTSGNDGAEQMLAKNGLTFVRVTNNSIVGNSVTVQSVYNGGVAGVVVKVDGISVGVCYGNKYKCQYFVNQRQDVDVYAFNENFDFPPNLVTLSQYQAEIDGNYGANKHGNFTITKKDGRIYIVFWE
ncbi:MAG: ComEC/Rec2 family competence protein [Clostridia bacterium]|nr:ComEC/Rec2 family competence protein [Clostridia bacterium]